MHNPVDAVIRASSAERHNYWYIQDGRQLGMTRRIYTGTPGVIKPLLPATNFRHSPHFWASWS